MATIIASGGFADIVDLGNGKVAKIFRRISHSHEEVSQWEDHNWITQQLFNAEVRAYDLIHNEDILRSYIPAYFGRIQVSELDLGSEHSNRHYLPDCAFVMERLCGEDKKVANIENQLKCTIVALLGQIKKRIAGIDVLDASCFIPGSRGDFTVVDFALWSGYPDAQCELAQHGSLSSDVRTRLVTKWQ